MSIAVLVIDMPERCMDCPFECGVEGHITANICRGCKEYHFNPDRTKKPDWCPLRPIPDEKDTICRQNDDLVTIHMKTDYMNKVIAGGGKKQAKDLIPNIKKLSDTGGI